MAVKNDLFGLLNHFQCFNLRKKLPKKSDIMDWVFIAFGLVCFFAGYQVQNLFELILDKKQYTQDEWEEEQRNRGNIK